MCFTIPLRVKSVTGDMACMEDGRTVKTGLVGPVKVGGWLLVKSDLAVEKLSAEEARSIRAALRESLENGT